LTYKPQSGVLTKIVADLKANGLTKAQVAAFFKMVVEAKYDA
jgi:hypothetical protein